MSSMYVSSGTHVVQVDALGATAMINTTTRTIEIRAGGRTITQVQCSTVDGESRVRLWITPPWLAWVFGERLTVTVLRRQGGVS